MDTATLEAQRPEAEAQLQRVTVAVQSTESLKTQREAEQAAVVPHREAELDGAQRPLARSWVA
jgi:HlyD family secretion protein